jgi:uncharacterized protein DUF6492
MPTPPKLLAGVGERLLFYLSQMSIQSDLRIDVVVPAAAKDLDVLPYAIDGVRRNIRHPVTNIFVVSPRSDRLLALCKRKGCAFVDERSLVDLDPRRIGLVTNGLDRSTWIYQQFLKWSADTLGKASHFLIVDADTVFVRPQVFERDGRIIFNYSDERHQAYFDMYQRLLREEVRFPLSFTSHQMLYDKSILAELKGRIEQLHACDWKEAVLRNLDRTELSSFSDYDTYGHYVFLHHPAPMAIEYWFNLSLRRKKNLRRVALLGIQYGGKYKSLSFHSYKD